MYNIQKGYIMEEEKIVKNLESIKNFVDVSKLADENGKVTIVENNKPKYIVINLENENYLELTDEEKLEIVAKRILKEHKKAFEVLGQ